MKTDLQVAVAADRVHRFLAKDQLVAFDLHSMWFDHGVIGVETASEVVMQKPLTAAQPRRARRAAARHSALGLLGRHQELPQRRRS